MNQIIGMNQEQAEEWKGELERTLGMALGVEDWPKRVLDKLRRMNSELARLWAFQREVRRGFEELDEKQKIVHAATRRPR